MVKNKQRIAWIFTLIWLLFLATIAFLWNLGAIHLVDETEPLFAEASRQMTVTGDWITPYFNEQTRFDKPPLIYWTQAIAYLAIGVNEWAVRLPSALSAIALMIFLFYTLWKVTQSQEQGDSNPDSKIHLLPFFGSGMMALNIETIAWGRIGVSDMLLTGCMCSALLAFFLGYSQQTTENDSRSATPEKSPMNFWYLAFYILIALAILSKGPVGIVLPGLIILLFLLYLGQFWTVFREMKPIRGCIIILAIALPWYILVTWFNGQEYLNSFFGYHNFERFTNVVNRHSAPWYFYFVVVLIGFAPWSVYLPLAIARLNWWKRKQWQRQPRTQQFGLFALCWFVGIFAFFSIAATKLPSYVLPLMPAAAILVAWLFTVNDSTLNQKQFSANLENLSSQNNPAFPKSILIAGWVNVVFLLLLAVACFVLPNFLENDPAMPNFQQALQASGVNLQGAIILGVTAATCSLILSFPNLLPPFKILTPPSPPLVRGGNVVREIVESDRPTGLFSTPPSPPLETPSGNVVGEVEKRPTPPSPPLEKRGNVVPEVEKHPKISVQSNHSTHVLWTINLVGFLAFFIFAVMPTIQIFDVERQQPVREMAATLMDLKQPDEEVVMIAFEKPSLVFYSHQPVTFFRRSTDAYHYLKAKAEGTSNPRSVLILGWPNKLRGAGLRSRHYQAFYEADPYQLVRVNLDIFRTLQIKD